MEMALASVAILIANAHYNREDVLECCLEDLEAMRSMVEAVGRHSVVRVARDVNADRMRDVLREALSSDGPYEEVLFYFSGTARCWRAASITAAPSSTWSGLTKLACPRRISSTWCGALGRRRS
jgi:hypothetical protein